VHRLVETDSGGERHRTGRTRFFERSTEIHMLAIR
jgi:hypothetical protein